MNRVVPHLVFALVVLAPGAPAASANEESAPFNGYVTEQLAEGVYLFRAGDDLEVWTSTNIVAIVDDEGVTVFDSGTRPATARHVIAGIRSITDKPVRTLVNSHWHMDHWTGNDEFVRAFPEVRIVATRQSRDFMKHMGSRFFTDKVGLERRREALAEAVRTGQQADGSPLTDEARAEMEEVVRLVEGLHADISTTRRIVPDTAFEQELRLFAGGREIRLIAVTGDATGSAILFLPRERILVTGDALVAPPNGDGPPPWTTNTYDITPWRDSLRRMIALGPRIVVPGQGPAWHDDAYLRRTEAVFTAVLDQVSASLESGRITLTEVLADLDVDELGRGYTPGLDGTDARFTGWVSRLARKAMQEATDGVANLN